MHSLIPLLRRAARQIRAPGVALCLAAGPLGAQAPQTFNACYVPTVGAIYLVGLTGLPGTCLASSHVAVSWTQGSAVADGSVTAVKLADGAVISVKLADGAVTTAKLAPGTTAGIAGYEVRHLSFTQPNGGAGSPVLNCPAGKRPLGGGASKAQNAVLHGDFPVVPPESPTFNGWVFVFGPTTNGQAATSELYVVCANAT